MNEEELKNEIERLKAWNKWFFGRVKFMRECQREYYKLRTSETLQKSKAVEKEIDDEIKRVDGIKLKEAQSKQYTLNF